MVNPKKKIWQQYNKNSVQNHKNTKPKNVWYLWKGKERKKQKKNPSLFGLRGEREEKQRLIMNNELSENDFSTSILDYDTPKKINFGMPSSKIGVPLPKLSLYCISFHTHQTGR